MIWSYSMKNINSLIFDGLDIYTRTEQFLQEKIYSWEMESTFKLQKFTSKTIGVNVTWTDQNYDTLSEGFTNYGTHWIKRECEYGLVYRKYYG